MASELLWRVHSAEEAQDPGGQGLCQVLGELSQSPSLSLEGSEMTTADQGLGLALEPEGGPGPLQPQILSPTRLVHVSITFAGTCLGAPTYSASRT